MSAWFSGGVMEFVLLLLCCPNRNFFPWEIRVAFPEESQLRQSRATLPELMTSLVSAVFLCDHTTRCKAYSFTTDGFGIFNVWTNLGVCLTHEGGSGANKSAQVDSEEQKKLLLTLPRQGIEPQGLGICIPAH